MSRDQHDVGVLPMIWHKKMTLQDKDTTLLFRLCVCVCVCACVLVGGWVGACENVHG